MAGVFVGEGVGGSYAGDAGWETAGLGGGGGEEAGGAGEGCWASGEGAEGGGGDHGERLCGCVDEGG